MKTHPLDDGNDVETNEDEIPEEPEDIDDYDALRDNSTW